MKPVIAIVGRPNVGKSTLFNRIVGEKRAIVLDEPGVTRDRHYGEVEWGGRHFIVVDTGGFEPTAETGLLSQMRLQALAAIEESDVVIFVMDGRSGLLPADREVVDLLRRATRPVFYAVNKVDGARQDTLTADFYETGIETLYPISAEHGRGVGQLIEDALDVIDAEALKPEEDVEGGPTRVALVGRPNVGKSTMTNRLLGEERMIVDSMPGTTRDAIDSLLQVDGREYMLVDTAGLRRARKIIRGSSEGLSVVQTLRALDRCHVAVLLLDATEGVTDQDARIAGLADEKGRALVLAVNKWDAIAKDPNTAKAFAEEIELKLPFAGYAPVLYISGLTGLRVHKLLDQVDIVRVAHLRRIGTGPLNRWLKTCTEHHHPPVVKNKPLKFYYATQVSNAPPTIMLSCNQPDGVHFSYRRYLVNQFRETFDVAGTPIRLLFRPRSDRDEDEG